MESLVYRGLLVLLVHRVNQDSLESRVTVVSLVFQDLQEKRGIRVNKEGQVHLGRLGWQGFQVPWDLLDPQDPLGHQGHHTVDLITRMDMRPMACLDSGAHLDHRVHLVLQVYLVNQVCQATMETKDQRDHGDLLGYQDWTGSPDSRVRRETEERKERWAPPGEMADHLDLRGLLDHRDRSPTSQQAMGEAAFRVEQDSQAPWDQRETKETQVLLDMHRKERKENLVSSWGLMGDLCTLVACQESRATLDPLALWDLQVRMVLQARRERSDFQVDLVDQA